MIKAKPLRLSTATENALIELHKTLPDDLQQLIDNEADTSSQLTYTRATDALEAYNRLLKALDL